MKTKKEVGIWMDYSSAYVMEMIGDEIASMEVNSEFTWEEKQHGFFKNEGRMHTKEKKLVTEYFNKISEKIAGSEAVLLFGPGEAKNELFNLLTANPQFKHVNMRVKTTDRLTENQRKSFFKNELHQTTVL
jgi:stalled ribosome rescue protein Dom34